MSEKRFTPQQAAQMVLAKAQELYRLSPLSKSEDIKKGEWDKIEHKLEGEGYSKKTADKINGSIKAKVEAKKLHKGEDGEDMSMSEKNPDEKNPDEKEDAKLGEKVEHEVEAHESENPEAEKQEHREKGSYKLAKFMGKMEMKKSQKAAPEMDKAETGYEKGVHTSIASNSPNKSHQGMSAAGLTARVNTAQGPIGDPHGYGADSKNQHKQVLDQIHQMSKPKLPG